MWGLVNLERLGCIAWVALVIKIILVVEGYEDSPVMTAMKRYKVVPDVLPKAPDKLLEVQYSSKRVNLGSTLPPSAVVSQPKLYWSVESGSFYTVCMTDPDAPSRSNPKAREWKHWLVVNIPQHKVDKGEILCSYAGSTPSEGSGLHRYVLVVYKQQRKLKFDEAKILDDSEGKRAKFSISKFAKKYNLGDPIAGNFFQSEWED